MADHGHEEPNRSALRQGITKAKAIGREAALPLLAGPPPRTTMPNSAAWLDDSAHGDDIPDNDAFLTHKAAAPRRLSIPKTAAGPPPPKEKAAPPKTTPPPVQADPFLTHEQNTRERRQEPPAKATAKAKAKAKSAPEPPRDPLPLPPPAKIPEPPIRFNEEMAWQLGVAVTLFPIAAWSFAFLWILPLLAPWPVLLWMPFALYVSLPGGLQKPMPRLKPMGEVCALLPALMCLIAAVCGSLTGLYAYEVYTAPYYAVALGSEYHNVLASTPAAAYADAGTIHFSGSSYVDEARALGYKNWRTYCVAPVVDQGPEQASIVSFWAVGVDCCTERSDFECGDTGNSSARSSLRAAPDGLFARPQVEFMRAINMSAAVYGLQVDENPVLLHWVGEASAAHWTFLLRAMLCVIIGTAIFALVDLAAFAVAAVVRSSSQLVGDWQPPPRLIPK